VPTTSPPEILGLLAEPVRWQLVQELGRSDRRVGELVQLLDKPQNLVSYHLGELRRAGLVTGRRSSADGRDVYYRADVLRCRELLGQAGAALHPGLAASLTTIGTTTSTTGRTRRRKAKVLFLCTGNSARSQIAEALAVERSGGAVEARSAGSHPKPLHPNAVRVMAERGIDIAGRPTKALTRFRTHRFDRVITLCDKVREVCPEFVGSPATSHWSMADPSATGDDLEAAYPAFRAVADEIDARLALLLPDLDAAPLAPLEPLEPLERTLHG
jgi:protein-tyrosine-phosphatase/DNA-binding transcriptional ArsR family regulator